MTETPGRRPSARAWRLLAGFIAGALILAAVLLGALRLALAHIPENAGRIQAWVERQYQLRVEFASLDARLRGYGPELVLRQVRVLDRDGTQALFETREGTIALDVWNLFRTGELVAGRVRALAPSVTLVRLPDGRIRLLGQRERPSDKPPFDFDRLPAGRVEVEDANVTYRDLMTGSPARTLQRLDLVLTRERDHVRASGSARLPPSLGNEVWFEGQLKGSLDTLADLEARVELHTDRLLLPGLAQYLPAASARPIAGVGPVRAMLGLARGRIDRARLSVDLEDVALQLPIRAVPKFEALETSAPYRPEGASSLSLPLVDKNLVQRLAESPPRVARYAGLAGDFRLRRDGDGWHFRATDLLIEGRDGDDVERASIFGNWRGNARTTFGLHAYVSRLHLDAAWPLLLAFAPRSFDRWSGLAPSGEIRQLRVEVLRERAGAPPRFEFSASLAGLGAQPVGRWPGISGLTANVSGTDQRGRIGLRSEGLAFDWPRQFREPIGALEARGEIDWRREGRAWVLGTKSLAVAQAQARARGSFEFTFERKDVSPLLTLDAEVSGFDIARVSRVLPAGRLKPRTLAWLDGAFVRGRLESGRVHYQGPVRRFPFREGEGDFTATADVRGATIDFFDGFAPLRDAVGRVTFHNAGLEASVVAGRVGGLRLARARVSIPELKTPVIGVNAAAGGDLGVALAFLQGSPLGPRLGRQFMGLTGRGPADYDVDLRIATGEPGQRDYRVRTTLHSVDVTLPALRAPAERVSGDFELHNLEARARALRGTTLGGPFELTVEPGPSSGNDAATVVLRGQGRAAGPRLPAFIGLPDSIRMDGSAAWTFDGRLERRGRDRGWAMGFAVQSDLRGLRIEAPRPFAKEPAVARPTRVALDIGPGGRNEVEIASGSARSRLAFVAGKDGRWVLERGLARFDGRPIGLPQRPGLVVEGDWPEFDLGEWLAMRSGGGEGRRLSQWLGPADVHLEVARVFGFEFRDVSARLQPQPAAWQVMLAGPMAEGRVTVPEELAGGRPIALEMQRLQLQSVAGDRAPEGEQAVDPRKLPALSVAVEDFTWESRRFGRLRAEVRKEPAGLRLASLETASPDFALKGRGSWLADGGASRTTLDLDFTSGDLAAASRDLGYRDTVKAGRARAVANLTWPGGPSEDVLRRMDGTLRLQLDDGQLTNVEPGAGRILGLMSVGDLPRRLSLDFRDVTDEGLAFDTVRGDFEIRAGSAYTKNLLLKGPAVDIGVAGRTGLATQDYDQTVVVSGNPSGPLTVAGALAAGPVGAAGVLLFSQLFKGQLQGLTRVYYRVTGPWSAPVVERITAQASEEASASASGASNGVKQ